MGDPRPQRDFAVVVDVIGGHEEELRAHLDAIGEDVLASEIPFSSLTTVHFMRWVLIDPLIRDGQAVTPTLLVLSTNYDPPHRRHVRELIECTGDALHHIYEHCVGYPDGDDRSVEAIAAYFERNRAMAEAFYCGHAWRTVQQIRDEADLVEDLQRRLDRSQRAGEWSGVSAREVRRALRESAEERGRAAEMSHMPRPVPRTRLRLVLGLARRVPSILLLAALSWWLRILERKDARRESRDLAESVGQMREVRDELVAREDYLVQNQMTHLVEIKPGWFRMFALRSVLRAIGTLAAFLYNRGVLGEITTIHFARWIILDDGVDRRLLFMSNFDGSWESYLGQFVDAGAKGLSGIWSNTLRFPPTTLLLWSGARSEDHFKTWARAQQIPTGVWYSAYPNLSVRNVLRNTELRRGLNKLLNEPNTAVSDRELETWARKL